MELTLTKFVTNHCDPPVLRRLSSECVASMLTHPRCWMPANTESSCSLIGCREMMLENVTFQQIWLWLQYFNYCFHNLLHGFLKATCSHKIPSH